MNLKIPTVDVACISRNESVHRYKIGIVNGIKNRANGCIKLLILRVRIVWFLFCFLFGFGFLGGFFLPTAQYSRLNWTPSVRKKAQ